MFSHIVAFTARRHHTSLRPSTCGTADDDSRRPVGVFGELQPFNVDAGIVPSTPHDAPRWVIEPFRWLLLDRGMLFRRLFVLRHRCCSSAATCRRHCSSAWKTSRPAIAGNPRCKNITAKSVHLTSLYPTALTSTNDHLSVLRHYVCT